MAQLKEKVIGKISGSIGDFVGRIRNGNNYISMRPSKYKTNNDPAVLERRGKFKMACKLSKAITSSYTIKGLWNESSTGGISAYNAALKVNYPFVNSSNISDNIILTPKYGFPITIDSINISSTGFNISLSPLNNADSFDPNIETKIKLYAILFLSGPNDQISEQYQFLSFNSDELVFATDSVLEFNVSFNGTESNIYNSYSNHKLHFMVYTINDNNQLIRFSNTLVGT